MTGYTYDADPETTWKAIGREMPISPKKSQEVCRTIRGMKVNDAKNYLEDVILMKRAIPFKRHNKGVAHKHGIHGPGRYPVKVAKAVIKVIESAQANAEYEGQDPDEMKILVISAHRGQKNWNYMPRAHGRSTPWIQETVNIEVILKSVEE